MRPYGRCGKCRQRFRITEDIAVCQKCSLVGDRFQGKWKRFVEGESDLDEYLERWYGDTTRADPRAGSSSSAL
jgi:hypothetical protein